METKYNVGDKVLVLDLSYLNSLFLNEDNIIKEYTVAEIDERYFYVYYNNVFPVYKTGDSELKIRPYAICQKTGIEIETSSCNPDRFFHKEKDKLEIISEIDKVIKHYDIFCKKNDSERKKELENIIANCKEEITQIDLGNGTFKAGFKTHKNKEFKKEFLSIIRKFFKY